MDCGGDMREFIYWIKWLYRGKPMVKYTRMHCGCCGALIIGEFQERNYLFDDFWSTWDICQKCIKGDEKPCT